MSGNNGKMQTVEVVIEGKNPYLMNPTTPELLEQLRTRVSKPKALDRSAKEEAATKLFRRNGRIGIPSLNLFSCLVEAGRDVELKPRQKISTLTSTKLPSFLVIEDMFLPFEIDGDENHDFETAWETDVQAGRNPKDKVKVVIVRPRFDKWGFKVRVTVDTSIISIEKVRQLFDVAGRSIGLGDFRPACRGMNGTFTVKDWRVLEAEQPLAA